MNRTNWLTDWGYNRDKKKGKKQIVIGLMCDEDGMPLTTEVFKGNTQDTKTFAAQVDKAKKRFKCETVTFVGDRGMIKHGQIDTLAKNGYHYITALTKKQIETLIDNTTIDYSLFDTTLCEANCEGIRYIFRRNPVRAQEIADSRFSKKEAIAALIADRNTYLATHVKAKVTTAIAKVNTHIQKLGLTKLVSVREEARTLALTVFEEMWAEDSKLDSCYVIKTDLLPSVADMHTVHARYKDLAFVESAFRTIKSDLDVRPVYVRKEESTRGHVLVVMLAYMIIRELNQLWSSLYLTVSEGLRSLATLCLLEISVKEGMTFQQVPQPRLQNQKLLKAANIELPKILPKSTVRVVTRVKRRKSALLP